MRKNSANLRTELASFTTTEIARKHHTTPEQVRRWIEEGDLVAIRRKNFIRVRPEALADFERRFTIGNPSAIATLQGERLQ